MDWAKHMRRILAHLGEDATYRPFGGGTSLSIRGMYLAPFQNANFGDVALIGTSDPQFAGMSADMPAVARGDTLEYPVGSGTLYKVRSVEPNVPSGLAVLQLEAP